MKKLKILVVDDEFEKGNTPQALKRVANRLRYGRVEISYYTSRHEHAATSLNNGYNALLIDNNHGTGLITLAKIRDRKIPIVYISPYPLDYLMHQYAPLFKAEIECVNPLDFKRLGITFVKREVKSPNGETATRGLERELYAFLMRIRTADSPEQ